MKPRNENPSCDQVGILLPGYRVMPDLFCGSTSMSVIWLLKTMRADNKICISPLWDHDKVKFHHPRTLKNLIIQGLTKKEKKVRDCVWL